ncbi:MAG: ECF transporter S component [Methanomassiliicoccales archaeon]|nr:ECF transporter S component [Methanomassiliicoccales archaeon]
MSVSKKTIIPVMGAVITLSVFILLSLFARGSLVDYATILAFFLVLFLVILLFARFEETAMSSKEVALVGILAAITAAARIPFAALPNIQPCTFLIIATGIVFGPLSGVMVGSMTAAVSNMFLGQGPWTVWQMAGWGLVGLLSGYIGRRKPEIGPLGIAVLGVILGMVYNTIMDFSSWIWLYGLDPTKFLAVFSLGLPFGIIHSIGNAAFALALGKPVLFAFRRFQRRFHVAYVDAGQMGGPSKGDRKEKVARE